MMTKPGYRFESAVEIQRPTGTGFEHCRYLVLGKAQGGIERPVSLQDEGDAVRFGMTARRMTGSGIAVGGVFDRVRGGEAEPLRFATGLSLGASVPSRESGR